MQVCVLGQLLEPFLENLGGERKIMLIQSEITRRQVNLAQPRICLLDAIVKPVQDRLRIHPAEQRDSAVNNQVPGIAVEPASVQKELLDLSR